MIKALVESPDIKDIVEDMKEYYEAFDTIELGVHRDYKNNFFFLDMDLKNSSGIVSTINVVDITDMTCINTVAMNKVLWKLFSYIKELCSNGYTIVVNR
jgi:hypothetical protein